MARRELAVQDVIGEKPFPPHTHKPPREAELDDAAAAATALLQTPVLPPSSILVRLSGAMAGGDAPQHKPIECPKCHGVFNTRREFVNHKCSNTRLFMLAQAKKAAKKAVLKQIRNKGNKFN
ncbi:Os08g0449400 [Oryza sativa Japonica Group]|uniref:Os08g0449400 protein n=1 Tax=Oryza sativa subsp. japonica TaxID=39947 RepID=Q0J5B3_ORYSJ|nr:hypothetical protein OsJ_27516 [Oryza sativa Japonica Group]KAF2919934.1 hypothetical protein DAI22_08g172300 [Oryza sativa Japonica Group]BAF23852.2 Os08g0449400 [Oryza sativa Japonica Group]|eukprot:NP_001061938.2 Os08g0449400 [Oryza sativa Japonica Group]